MANITRIKAKDSEPNSQPTPEPTTPDATSDSSDSSVTHHIKSQSPDTTKPEPATIQSEKSSATTQPKAPSIADPKLAREAEKEAKKAKKQAAKEKKRATKAEKRKNRKPLPKPLRIILKPFTALGAYIRHSWQELRQVRWPNRKTTWKMTLAVIIYTGLFIAFIMLLDALFTALFNILLG